MKKDRNYEIDMCTGPLLRKIAIFTVPLMLSGILQLLYNAADIVVVGRFTGYTALAAVGSTGSLINLVTNLFIGLAVGASVLTANDYGAGKLGEVSDTVHTSMTVSLIGGVGLGVFGVVMARKFMVWMGSPEDVIDLATVYLRIYFAGMPASMIYNFGSAILRAVGDTRRPLYYLSMSGLVNVLLNLLFVIVFHMGVAGVALATVISQVMSAALVLNCLMRSESCIRLDLRRLRVKKAKLLKLARVGLPAGLQGTIFSISNVIIQSGINSFGSMAVAGSSAAGNIEGFVYTGVNSLHQAALSFAGQNMGARKYKRVGRVALISLLLCAGLCLVLGPLVVLAGKPLLSIYSSDPGVIDMGYLRLKIMCLTYVGCALMDVMTGQLRGMGYSIMPMCVTILGVCGIRITWLYTVFAQAHTLETLYISYPVSWLATALVHFGCFAVVYRKLLRRGDAVTDE